MCANYKQGGSLMNQLIKKGKKKYVVVLSFFSILYSPQSLSVTCPEKPADVVITQKHVMQVANQIVIKGINNTRCTGGNISKLKRLKTYLHNSGLEQSLRAKNPTVDDWNSFQNYTAANGKWFATYRNFNLGCELLGNATDDYKGLIANFTNDLDRFLPDFCRQDPCMKQSCRVLLYDAPLAAVPTNTFGPGATAATIAATASIVEGAWADLGVQVLIAGENAKLGTVSATDNTIASFPAGLASSFIVRNKDGSPIGIPKEELNRKDLYEFLADDNAKNFDFFIANDGLNIPVSPR